MGDEQAGVVGWVVAAAIDLWWSGLPRLPAGMATLPAAARASFGLSSLSTWPEQPQPGAVWKAQQRQPPPSPGGETMSKRLEGLVLKKKRSWKIVELLGIMVFFVK